MVISKNRIQQLVARATALRADHVDVDDEQRAWNLPDLAKCNDTQLGLWQEMLVELELKLEAPFDVPTGTML